MGGGGGGELFAGGLFAGGGGGGFSPTSEYMACGTSPKHSTHHLRRVYGLWNIPTDDKKDDGYHEKQTAEEDPKTLTSARFEEKRHEPNLAR